MHKEKLIKTNNIFDGTSFTMIHYRLIMNETLRDTGQRAPILGVVFSEQQPPSIARCRGFLSANIACQDSLVSVTAALLEHDNQPYLCYIDPTNQKLQLASPKQGLLNLKDEDIIVVDQNGFHLESLSKEEARRIMDAHDAKRGIGMTLGEALNIQASTIETILYQTEDRRHFLGRLFKLGLGISLLSLSTLAAACAAPPAPTAGQPPAPEFKQPPAAVVPPGNTQLQTGLMVEGIHLPPQIQIKDGYALSRMLNTIKPDEEINTANFGARGNAARLIQYYDSPDLKAQILDRMNLDQGLADKGYFVYYAGTHVAPDGRQIFRQELRYVSYDDSAAWTTRVTNFASKIQNAFEGKYTVTPYGSSLWNAASSEHGFTVGMDNKVSVGVLSDVDVLLQPKTLSATIPKAVIPPAEIQAAMSKLAGDQELFSMINNSQLHLFASQKTIYDVSPGEGVRWYTEDLPDNTVAYVPARYYTTRQGNPVVTTAGDTVAVAAVQAAGDFLAKANLIAMIVMSIKKPLGFGLHPDIMPGIDTVTRIKTGAEIALGEYSPEMIDWTKTLFYAEWPITFIPQDGYLVVKGKTPDNKELDFMRFGVKRDKDKIVLKFRRAKDTPPKTVLAYVTHGKQTSFVDDEIKLDLDSQPIEIVYPDQTKQTVKLGVISQKNSSLKGAPALIIENSGTIS